MDERSILKDLDLKGLDNLLTFDEMGNVQIKSDKAGSFLVKLQSHSTFWPKLQKEFVKNELLWETNSKMQKVALVNIKAMFDGLLKLLMIFDDDLIDRLVSQNFFSTLKGICQFVLNQKKNEIKNIPKFEDFQNDELIKCGPLFIEISDKKFRERLIKMKYLYQYFLSKILNETKNETLTVFF